MTRAAFFVLAALADRPRHGYGILREVEELSDGEVQLRVGTLYGVLWFFIKTYTFVAIAVLLRVTLVRIRVDQLMGVAWKVLLPLAMVNLVVTAGAVVAFKL